MNIKRIDYLALNVANIPRAVRFYHEVFDMPIISENTEKAVMRCGHQLLELQLASAAKSSQNVSFCIVASTPMEDVLNHLASYYIPTLTDPVEKVGASGKMIAVKIKDYDENIIEIAVYRH
ncbi:VOC family protein [Liquorilactobacillus mali]|uniref:Lactoylglutathione lyase family protein n=1 Tax=Liquorilactobacillus mali KCTC 3596 = DSM 20444 TaxID=1046596 RepID=J0US62_9LACO|nr:VOC family protein [Liquorilactobacillus mali]EJE99679.1 lactoylglutathione lyase family protein [Liquorilactobacillus mali KCTC 3596 = DSM 20444]KRN10013.1 lactoylglutathione lyase family protein [Liquorilactobacillus mali KCTC 3596 = DSM 20444]MDC7953513.1 VOC family protein [Liquorilactobacillus mali]MDV7758503.1 VOC family protein [Liquorilactobacillus mali]QFQ73842.1 VOC family protein [Liquorilactobacillus mali]